MKAQLNPMKFHDLDSILHLVRLLLQATERKQQKDNTSTFKVKAW